MSKVFAERLRAARELRKMSQSDLANATKLQPSAVSHFETGRRAPSFQNLKALSDALNVTTDYLIGRTEESKSSNSGFSALLRHANRMSDEDRKTLTSMAKVMADKQKK